MPGPIENTVKRTKRWKMTTAAGDEYQGHTSAIEINPNPVSWRGGDDNTVTDDGDLIVTVTTAQDTENAASLWRLMRDNAGDVVTFEIFPHHDGTFSESVDVTLIKPPLIMNRSGNMPEVQVQLPGCYTPAAE